jgi:hypothetical protein
MLVIVFMRAVMVMTLFNVNWIWNRRIAPLPV